MKKSVAIIGGGPSALMLAAELDQNKFNVTIYEKNAAVGRKLLVAGDGGFNLTHSEEIEPFINRYTPASFFNPIISAFTNTDFRKYLHNIGIETFVGTSKRIFPVKGIKPIDVLNALLNSLKKRNVSIQTKCVWQGWNNDKLVFADSTTTFAIKPDIAVFALGGASWKVTGSDGQWAKHFADKGITTLPFHPSNCAVEIKWSAEFIKQAEGQSLKNITLRCGNVEKKGEVVITKFGLEGGAIYALSGAIREQLNNNKSSEVFLDLKPSYSIAEIESMLANRGNEALTKYLKNELNMSSIQLGLLRAFLNKDEFTNNTTLAEKIKNLRVTITGTATLDEAISTVGGIPLEEIDNSFQLRKQPHHYVIGEMLDWDAPTGGYLLQGCFSMGYFLAKQLNEKY